MEVKWELTSYCFDIQALCSNASSANLLLAQINMLPELSDGIQKVCCVGSIVDRSENGKYLYVKHVTQPVYLCTQDYSKLYM